jgi:hypothetical protein
MNKKTITLYTVVWGGYWDKYGSQWSSCVNSFEIQPEEIIIVSDVEIDVKSINNKNIKNIVIAINNPNSIVSEYRNIAVKNATSDWIVASDIDDHPLPNYLNGLDIDADICAFSFKELNGNIYKPDANSLNDRLNNVYGINLIPGTSAIKRSVFEKIRYEEYTHEDLVLYSTASRLNLNIVNVYPDSPRFIYNGFHVKDNDKEIERVSEIYKKVLSGNRNIYCFWFSDNMSDNRKKCLKVLKENSNVNIVLIDYEQFYLYENTEIPIHPGFKYLSDVHKSAYGRAYMMYFYGEGYSDIKANAFDWNPYFDDLFTSRADAIGYAEKSYKDIAPFWNGDIPEEVKNKYNKFAGNGHYIFKPKTKFAHEWLLGVHDILDKKYDILKSNPGSYSPYAISGGDHREQNKTLDYSLFRYPIEWNEINGRVRQAIEYNNNFNNFRLSMPFVNMKDYR